MVDLILQAALTLSVNFMSMELTWFTDDNSKTTLQKNQHARVIGAVMSRFPTVTALQSLLLFM